MPRPTPHPVAVALAELPGQDGIGLGGQAGLIQGYIPVLEGVNQD